MVIPPGGVFAWPVAGAEKRVVDSSFGVRTIESLGTAELHDGVDIAAEEGALVVAARKGRVAWVGQRPAFGWTVILEHEDRWQTVYANLAPPLVAAGALLAEGDELARTGSRCDARAGSCLHFEIRREGRAVDPVPLLTGGSGP